MALGHLSTVDLMCVPDILCPLRNSCLRYRAVPMDKQGWRNFATDFCGFTCPHFHNIPVSAGKLQPEDWQEEDW